MKKFQWWKWLLIWALFLVLHFSYDFFPNNFTLIFGERTEAIITHMKMAFWAYLFVSIIEFFVRRKKIASIKHFIMTRLFVAVIYPWITITIWFTAIALGIQLPEIPWEIIYANIVTIIGIYIGLRLEEALGEAKFHASLYPLIVLLFALSLLCYLSFTFNPPVPGYFFVGP